MEKCLLVTLFGEREIKLLAVMHAFAVSLDVRLIFVFTFLSQLSVRPFFFFFPCSEELLCALCG